MSATQDATQIGTSTASGCATGGPVGCAAGAIKGVISSVISELAQHTARLKNAKNENAAIVGVYDPFDADVAEMVSAFNNGTASASDVAQAAADVNSNIVNFMYGVGGKKVPGVAWDSNVGMSGKCNKQCTAACCVYFGDIGPVLSMINVAMGGPGFGWGINDPRYHAGSGGSVSIDVPEIFASKYGGRDRKGYSITFTPPAVVQSVQGTLQRSISSLFGGSNAVDPLSNLTGGTNAPAPAGSSVGILGGSSPTLTIILVFLALLLGVAVLRK
jgi:hypothetical protein